MLYSRVLLASFRSMRYWLLFALVHFENLITVYCLFENILNTIILRCLKCPIQYWSCAIATCARLHSRPFATFIWRIQQWLFTFPLPFDCSREIQLLAKSAPRKTIFNVNDFVYADIALKMSTFPIILIFHHFHVILWFSHLSLFSIAFSLFFAPFVLFSHTAVPWRYDERSHETIEYFWVNNLNSAFCAAPKQIVQSLLLTNRKQTM